MELLHDALDRRTVGTKHSRGNRLNCDTLGEVRKINKADAASFGPSGQAVAGKGERRYLDDAAKKRQDDSHPAGNRLSENVSYYSDTGRVDDVEIPVRPYERARGDTMSTLLVWH